MAWPGRAVETDWRCRSAGSASEARPGAAAAAFVTLCQPKAGVRILVSVPGAAVTAPEEVHTAVTLMVPLIGIVTLGGSAHCVPRLALSTMRPLVMVEKAWPTMVTTALLLLPPWRRMPLILTMFDRPTPCAYCGAKPL